MARPTIPYTPVKPGEWSSWTTWYLRRHVKLGRTTHQQDTARCYENLPARVYRHNAEMRNVRAAVGRILIEGLIPPDRVEQLCYMKRVLKKESRGSEKVKRRNVVGGRLGRGAALKHKTFDTRKTAASISVTAQEQQQEVPQKEPITQEEEEVESKLVSPADESDWVDVSSEDVDVFELSPELDTDPTKNHEDEEGFVCL